MAEAGSLRWGRIIAGGFLVELVLVALTVPMFAFMETPFLEGADPAADYTLVFALIAVAAFLAGMLGGWWVARPLASGRALHGALTGIVATLMYVGLTSIPPNSLVAVFAVYGTFWFTAANGLRIAGCVAGSLVRR